MSFSASSSACSVRASWAFSSVGEDIVTWDGGGRILKKISNQSNTEGVGAKEVLIVLSIQNRYCIYTVLLSVLKQKCGLELEMEYSAVNEGYMYVFIRFVHGTKRVCTQCTVCVAWSLCGIKCCQRCRIRYCCIRYFIV
jgi:hypothetical protein